MRRYEEPKIHLLAGYYIYMAAACQPRWFRYALRRRQRGRCHASSYNARAWRAPSPRAFHFHASFRQLRHALRVQIPAWHRPRARLYVRPVLRLFHFLAVPPA